MNEEELRQEAKKFMDGFDKNKLFTHKAVEDIVFGIFKYLNKK